MNSLSKAKNFVADAFLLAPVTPFVPENIKLGEYTFLPWVRTGLAAAVTGPAAPAEGKPPRANATIHVKIEGDNGATKTVDKDVTLRGPGDVVGIDSHEIVRRVPAPNSFNVEESFLAHVEFNRPELPWLFSPFAPEGNDQLRPWLALVVCGAERATVQPGPAGLPQQLLTHRGELQPLDDAWAWAHAQVIGPKDGAPTVDDRLTEDYAPTNLSRILCPRKLEPGKSYIACLVPTFDCGVKAGLGSGPGTLAWAWERSPGDADKQITLPVYDSWRFSVGPAGDFESLAERLVGIAAPWQIGRRMIDTGDPRGGMPALPAGAPGEIQVLRCALVSPTLIPPGAAASETNVWPAATRDTLRKVIDTSQGTDALPRVGPRVYAQFQRAQKTIGKVFGDPPISTDAARNDWFAGLNTAPMNRIVAGVGTRVVQHDREPLMQAAWQQVGEINLVNLALTRIQFGRFLGQAVLDRHLGPLGLGDLAQALRGVQGKVRLGGSTRTVHGLVGASRVPAAAMTSAFRRATRSRGPVGRVAGNIGALRQSVASQDTFKDMRLTYAEPDGVSGLSERGIAAISTEVLSRKFAVTPQAARQTAAQKLGRRPGAVTIADRLLSPMTSWHVPARAIDLATLAGKQIANAVDTAPTRLAADGARAEAIAPLLVGIANGGPGNLGQNAKLSIERINGQLPFTPASRVTPVLGGVGNVGAPAIAAGIAANRAALAARVAAGPHLAPVAIAPVAVAPVAVGPVAVAPVVIAHDVIAAPRAGAGAAAVGAPDPLHRFETSVSRALTAAMVNGRAVPSSTVATALSQFAQGIGVVGMKPTPDRPALTLTRPTLLGAVAPAVTATAYARSRLARVPDWLPATWFDDGLVTPIMAAPHFDRAMYQALDAFSRDWLVPGLGTIAETDFVTVLLTNPVFTEAFLVGLSDEMGRELLWRDFPTDQRGTYFRRFWDETSDELKSDIHRFSRTALGSHIAHGGGATEGRVVLVMRGELFRRYPDAIVVAVREQRDPQGNPIFSDPPTTGQEGAILFHAHLDPNFRLVGFDLTKTQLLNESWWFLVAEHPSAPRFGLELIGKQSGTLKRADMHWNDLGPLRLGRFLSPGAPGHPISISDPDSNPPATDWPGNAAIVARTLLHDPVRAAFDAHSLVKS
jgi:hypothetical protein